MCSGFLGTLGLTVVDNAANTVDLVHNAPRHALQELAIEGVPICSHEIRRLHRPECNNLVMHPLITHNTHRLDRQQRRKRLADVPVQPGLLDLFDENVVGLARNADLLARNLAKDADRDTRTGEGVAPDKLLVDAKLDAQGADFVFEELAQGFDELEVHVCRKATDVVVRLDGLGRALEGERLDDVWVQGALEEPFNLACVGRVVGCFGNLLCFLLEDLDESVADDFALLLRVVGDALEAAEEEIGGVDDGQIDTQALLERLLDLLGLVQAQHTVVDHDGVEAVANGLLHQLSGDSGVDTTADGANDLALFSDKLPDARNLLVDELAHGPIGPGLADVDGEILEEDLALGSVGDLWVELDAVHLLGAVRNTGVGRVGRRRNRDKVFGHVTQLVAVAHPDLDVVLKALEQLVDMAAVLLKLEVCVAVLPLLAGCDTCVLSKVPGHLLQSVANSENGHAEVENGVVDVRCALLVDRVRPAGQDDALGCEVEVGQLGGAWQHLRVDIEFAQTSSDQVRVLGPKVEHQDGVEGLVRGDRVLDGGRHDCRGIEV